MSNKLFLITPLFIFLLESSVTAQRIRQAECLACKDRIRVGVELVKRSQNPKSMDTLNMLCNMEKDLLKYEGKTIRFFLESMPIKSNRYRYSWVEYPFEYMKFYYMDFLSIDIYVRKPYKNPQFFDWDTLELNFELIKDEIIYEIYID